MDILIVFLTIIALALGLISIFGGYKLFMIFLPFINLVIGFLITLEIFEMIFGGNAYESMVAIAVAIIVGIVFALLSYLFYIMAVGLAAGIIGFNIGASIFGLFVDNLGVFALIVSLTTGLILAFATIQYDLDKYIIFFHTSLGGAAIFIGTLMLDLHEVIFGKFFHNPVHFLVESTPLWTLLFLGLSLAGIIAQALTNKDHKIIPYGNRIWKD